MQLIDTHCHLDYDYAPKTEAQIVQEAWDAGLVAMVTIGTEVANFEKVQAVSDRYARVFHTVGVHPHEAVTLAEGYLDRMREAARHPKCRAIGEIGLDYYYDHSPREIQQRRFDEQLDLALEVGLPVVIHARDAEEDLLAALRRYCAKLPPGRIPGIIHCFSGTRAFGEAAVEIGFYLSFSGIVTFKTAQEIRDTAAWAPLDRVLVETDSPYLAPVPYRGKKCEPSMVRMNAQKVAEVKGLTLEEVARATTENACRVFGISLG